MNQYNIRINLVSGMGIDMSKGFKSDSEAKSFIQDITNISDSRYFIYTHENGDKKITYYINKNNIESVALHEYK